MKQQSKQLSSLNGMGEDKSECLQRDKFLEKLAKDGLGIQTLEPRRRDGLDFYDGEDGCISVMALKDVLQQAYDAGRKMGLEYLGTASRKKKKENVALLGTTTLRRMLNAVYDENNILHKRNIYSECIAASARVEENPSDGDETVYVYYHRKENRTVMTNIKDDVWGTFGSSAGFEGKAMP